MHAPPLYIQEKIHPKALIDDLLRTSRENPSPGSGRGQGEGVQPDLFSDFNGIPKGVDKTEFYQHDQNWSNRMILGDSLQVMTSLAEREGLRRRVQCIYFDPPYGIKFNSNFQWSTTSREVKTEMRITSLANLSRSKHSEIPGAMAFTAISHTSVTGLQSHAISSPNPALSLSRSEMKMFTASEFSLMRCSAKKTASPRLFRAQHQAHAGVLPSIPWRGAGRGTCATACGTTRDAPEHRRRFTVDDSAPSEMC